MCQSHEARNNRRSATLAIFLFRYGNEEKLVTTYGVMQALVSFISHGDDEGTDTLKCVVSDDRKIVFLIKEHLIMVAVSR